jgi:uncharacterized protein (TIGR00251 family)
MLHIREDKDGLIISVYVQPRSSKCSICGCHNQALKIKLTAPPVEGAANKQCLETLAKAIALPKSALEIVGGQTHRVKQIKIRLPGGGPKKTDLQNLRDKLLKLALNE